MAEEDFLTSPRSEGPDLEERDYFMLNSHVQVEFEDIFAEPEGNHSHDCVWNSSYNCFNFCRTFWYIFNTLCCGLCAAMHAGCQMANAFFCYIWCAQPCLRLCEECLVLPRKVVNHCVDCLLRPCCELVSRHLKDLLGR